MAVTDSVDAGVGPALVETIQDIEAGDLLVVNGDTRTWDVTDVVERAIEDPTDDRESKRVLRLNSRSAVFGLELVRYPDHHEVSLYALESPDWTEDGRVFDVDDVEVLDQRVPWVVVSGGKAEKYHFPDPQAAAYGEAAPACGAGNQGSTYRITRCNAVVPAYSGCKDCLRHAKPVTLQAVRCPDCRKHICQGVLQRVEAAAIDGLSITCPQCGFDSVVDAELAGEFADID
ncbi:hypothetical protein GOC83_19505 [Haloarcula rubripromontorii]|uniref:Uncharacterized protein n=1 Tax=Haloarcula rubripromontorii TaxID=1705562 RepID=A0A847U7M5_9EURY|nr:hypothetical protein [Haloarcula rubripromontorii]NLV08307.1 hypothetical protein [Haloarcula rubripromontorii]